MDAFLEQKGFKLLRYPQYGNSLHFNLVGRGLSKYGTVQRWQ